MKAKNEHILHPVLPPLNGSTVCGRHTTVNIIIDNIVLMIETAANPSRIDIGTSAYQLGAYIYNEQS